ncbi:HD-GYP domain-containing protein [Niveibacterium terrae]|uniref:HD-GYP domain-containing protein n=1 Tax=Niveibacterium terrae TaxID=3373598 RepID=UPI003A8F75A8
MSSIKKVSSAQLKVGMYLHDLDCGWMDHPFLRSSFAITDEEQIEKIRQAGIHEAYIDTSRGLDVSDAPTAEEVRAGLEQEMQQLASATPPPPERIDVAAELGRARQIKDQASGLVRSVMKDVRLGKVVELEQVEPMVQTITESVLRNGGALLTLLRIKNKDDYTFLHSVSVGTLLIAFCRAVGLDATTTHQAGLGGLLHDTGKALVPDAVLNKPGRLTEEEFEIIKRHPGDGWKILTQTPGIGPIPLDITRHHHERMDGSGYPDKLPGAEISTLAKMAAIVDVYDAITADRCYHKGMAATDALRKLFEWSKFHFDPALVQSFMRCVGIYPVGTLVRMESGKLGVVIEQDPDNLLTPTVKIFFSLKSNGYVEPYLLNLARPLGHGGGDRIVTHEDPAKLKIDPLRFLATA